MDIIEGIKYITEITKEFFTMFWELMNSHWILQIMLYGALITGTILPLIKTILRFIKYR